MEHAISLVLTTFPADKDADAFARTLVDERLAACVNVLPVMRSIYSWQGATERAEERQLVIKTSTDRLRDLERRIHELHPYEVPEFIALPVETAAPGYRSWIFESTRCART
ncbi:MAG: divalent-cation tolerance protein CutA [Vicinamibacterales bacterium]